jgi:hypothetical protein
VICNQVQRLSRQEFLVHPDFWDIGKEYLIMNQNEEREPKIQGTMSRGPRGEAAYGDDRGYGSSTDYRNDYEGGQGEQSKRQGQEPGGEASKASSKG